MRKAVNANTTPPPPLGFTYAGGVGRTAAVGLIGLAILFGGCRYAENAETDADWDAGNGMIYVRIPIDDSPSRMNLPLDMPGKEVIDYFEAVFRETGTDFYYRAEASRGMSFLMVPVLAERNYDVLVLAGVTVYGKRVLLASGWVPNHYIPNGPHTITVPMTRHKDEGGFSNSSAEFVYKPTISNLGNLIAAAAAVGVSPALDAALAEAYWSGPSLPDTPVPLASSVIGASSLSLTFAGVQRADLPGPDADCYIYFDVPYRAFSDPAPQPDPPKTLWHIRRGITHSLSVIGGAALLQYTAQDDLYYVSQLGLDTNDGKSTATPFRTLGRATAAVASLPSPAPAHVYVNVISHLNETAPNQGTAHILSGGQMGTTIHIKGAYHVPTASPYITVTMFTPNNNGRLMSISGSGLTVSFENIILTGGVGNHLVGFYGAAYGGGLLIQNNAQVTLGPGAIVRNNTIVGGGSGGRQGYGGGIFVWGNASLSIQAGAVVQSNSVSNAGDSHGNGIYIASNGTVTLDGGIIRNNVNNNAGINYGGGAYVAAGGTFTINRGEMYGNTTISGKGHQVYAETGAEVNIPGLHSGAVAAPEWFYNAAIAVP